jgi:YD repeat-containing protein
MKTTIAQQLKIKNFPFFINDKNGNLIYHETSDGYWSKREYDACGNLICHEDSDGYWYKNEYDAHGNRILYEDSDGYWYKNEYDAHGNRILYEDSDGKIMDNRPKVVEVTLQHIADELGINVTRLRIKN